METKQIPFSLEIAKKIQAGEIEGKIKYAEGDGYAYDADIIKFDLISNESKVKSNSSLFKTIVAVIDYDNYQDVGTFNTDGYGYNRNGDDTKLFIEVPDNDSQKSQFNPSYSIEQLDKLKKYTEQLMKVNQSVINDLGNMLQELKETCNSLLKTEFKSFDKVLVRNSSNQMWHPNFYATTDGLLFYTIDSKNWCQCIPYTGNESLVGTTNKP